MAKYPEFVDKSFQELTKDDIHSMIRVQGLRISVVRMINYYEVSLEEYLNRIQDMGFKITSAERQEIYELKNKDKQTINESFVYHIPDSVLCALYDVEFEMVGRTPYYNQEQLARAREHAQQKVLAYEERKTYNKAKEVLSNLKPIDLVAMRIYRGVNREKFASKILKTIGYVKELESTSPVTEDTAKLYMETLKITNRHIKQLRKVMTGKLDKVTDDRTIPKLVKLKVWKRDKGKCSECGAKEKLHYHHIEHYADGGQNTVENLTLLCVSCHAEVHKGDKSYYMLKAQSER